MNKTDNDLDLIGAEAFPGGLGEISKARDDQLPPAGSAAPTRQTTPLVGLIDLLASWISGPGSRR